MWRTGTYEKADQKTIARLLQGHYTVHRYRFYCRWDGWCRPLDYIRAKGPQISDWEEGINYRHLLKHISKKRDWNAKY